MIFGSKETFAIEAEFSGCDGDFVFGDLLLWLGGTRFGDRCNTTTLNICYDDFRLLVRNFDAFEDPFLSYLDTATILRLFVSIGEADAELLPDETIEIFSRYQGHILSLDFDGLFDRHLIFATVRDKSMRFGWAEGDEQENPILETCKEAWVEKSELVSVVEEYCGWYRGFTSAT